MNNENKIIDLGYVFKQSTRTASKVLIVICLMAGYVGFSNEAFGMSFAAFLVLLIAILILNYKSSVEINLETNQFRESTQLFFYKSGKWRKLSSYKDVAILTTRKSLEVEKITIHSIQNSVYIDDEKETAVYLLTASHRHRVLIQVCDNFEAAELYAKNIAAELNKNYTVFSPTVSQVSKNKRR
mgnify:CR=1 FL=1